jgi:hypothetical protein
MYRVGTESKNAAGIAGICQLDEKGSEMSVLGQIQRINFLDVALDIRNISRFVADADSLKIWSREYFYQLAQRITIIRD